jgi:hypothetical protein
MAGFDPEWTFHPLVRDAKSRHIDLVDKDGDFMKRVRALF